MAQFDKSKVYTTFNLDEIKIGSKVYGGNCKRALIKRVEDENEKPCTLIEIDKESDNYPFIVGESYIQYEFVYLVEPPEEKKLKVSDLKLGDIVRHKSGNLEYLVTGIDHSENEVFFGDDWSDDENLGKYWEKVEK